MMNGMCGIRSPFQGWDLFDLKPRALPWATIGRPFGTGEYGNRGAGLEDSRLGAGAPVWGIGDHGNRDASLGHIPVRTFVWWTLTGMRTALRRTPAGVGITQ